MKKKELAYDGLSSGDLARSCLISSPKEDEYCGGTSWTDEKNGTLVSLYGSFCVRNVPCCNTYIYNYISYTPLVLYLDDSLTALETSQICVKLKDSSSIFLLRTITPGAQTCPRWRLDQGLFRIDSQVTES